MIEELESVPYRDRLKSISVWLVERPYLRTWRSARWLVLLLLPIGVSAGATIARGFSGIATIGIALIGMAVAFCLFAVLASGVESSNWGTFLRRREPIRFWIGVVILAMWYFGMSAAGWLLRSESEGQQASLRNAAVTSKPN